MAVITVGSNGVYKTQYVTKQKPPFRNPLPYLTYGGTQRDTRYPYVTSGEFPIWGLGRVQGNEADGSYEVVYATAKAYDKLLSKIKGEASAMLSTNLAEREQSIGMIVKRAVQLKNCYSHLKALRLGSFLKELGFERRNVKGKPSTWVRLGRGRACVLTEKKVQRDSRALARGSKSVASLWLEYHFGWSPLVQDIYGSLDVIAGTPPVYVNSKFTASATKTGEYVDVYKPYKLFTKQVWSCGVKYQCNVEVTSPGSLKLSQLGIVNPLSVAWEVVPFSFVVDWFLPVGRFLESMTDTVGLKISRVQQTHYRKYSGVQSVGDPHGYVINSTAFHFSRKILSVLPTPKLTDRRGTGIRSLTRGATAVALLVGFLKSK